MAHDHAISCNATLNDVSQEKEGTLSGNQYTFQLPPGEAFGITVRINTTARMTVRVTSPGRPPYQVTASSTPPHNPVFVGNYLAGNNGEVTVELFVDGDPVRLAKYAYDIFNDGPGFAFMAAEIGVDNDFNDARVMLNWPLG